MCLVCVTVTKKTYTMKKRNSLSTLFIALFITATTVVTAQETKMVGGAEMYPTKNIVENAVNSKDHTTLVAAVINNAIKSVDSEFLFFIV